YSLDGVVATGGIGQDGVLVGADHIEQVRLTGVLADVGAAHRHGDDLGTGSGDGVTGLVHILVLAGTDQQTRLERTTSQGEGLVAANLAHGILLVKSTA